MVNYFIELLSNYGVTSSAGYYLANIISIFIIASICYLAKVISNIIILKYLYYYIKNNNFKWDNIMLERKVFQRFLHIIPAIIIYIYAPSFPKYQILIQDIVFVYVILIIVLVMDSVIEGLHDIYKTFKIAKNKSIKSFVQVIKLVIYIIGVIIIVANIMGESPLYILSGIGALAAVLMLVFRDSILGLVAGIQIVANDMVRIGDWIEMPKYEADGDVIEISLNTIKVKNFDNTITTIPSYALISDSFRNWRGMIDSGARRIKRSIYIDINSVQFCDQKMIDRFSKIHYLTEYIKNKTKDIETYNSQKRIDTSIVVNARKLTNIGTFRVYIQEYLKNHPKINKDMIVMVRQLPVTEHGLPLEIYAFSNDPIWTNYESIQADIFDHIISVATQFSLSLFQEPTGGDFKNLITEKV